MKNSLIILALCVLILPSAAIGQRSMRMTVPSSLVGTTLVAVADSGEATSKEITSRSFRFSPPSTTSRVYLLQEGKVSKELVVPVCRTDTPCTRTRSSTKVLSSIKAGARLTVRSQSGLLVATSTSENYRSLARGSSKRASQIASTIGKLGLGSASEASVSAVELTPGPDADGDGLHNSLDVDDDNDSILDNYDSTNVAPTNDESFRVFSNLKLDIDASLNLHATGLDTARIDAALEGAQTLAIALAGEGADSVELDCGSLEYCSAGGTGDSNGAFPGTPGGANDADSDGKGTLTAGGTGDFQLQTRTSSSKIGAGDTYIQIINEGTETEREVPGILNFAFISTPALKTVAVNENAAVALDYDSSPLLGQRNNCVEVPATGDVSLTLTGWRPQRLGITDAGESEYMDIGGSTITIDIPNGACSDESGFSCVPQGAGNCSAGAYSSTDPNITIDSNGARDTTVDVAASSTNTFTFTIDLSECLANAQSGAVSWSAGQTLFVDLQFRSSDGDNAAQKFCVVRAAS